MCKILFNKQKKISFFVLILYLNLSIAYSAPLIGKINKDGINIRSDSTIYGEVLTKLKKGNTVKIIKEKFGWYKIILPSNFISYVDKNYLEKEGETHFIVKATILNLRSKPSLDAPVVGSVRKGTSLRIAKREGKWVGVYGFPYAYGWVHKKFVEVVRVNLPKKADNIPTKKQICIKDRNKEEKKPMYPSLDYNIFTVKGVISPLTPLDNCPANYILKNEISTFFLSVDNHQKIDSFIGEEVTIQGERRHNGCSHIKVSKILLSE